MMCWIIDLTKRDFFVTMAKPKDSLSIGKISINIGCSIQID